MIPPMKNVNIFGAQIDRRKCFDTSSDQNFEFFWYPIRLEEMFNLNIFGVHIDWRKCFDKPKILELDG